MRHDEDPEETYGLVRSDRTPKPAFQVVTAMFAERSPRADGSYVRDGGVIGDRAGGRRRVDLGTPSSCAADDADPVD